MGAFTARALAELNVYVATTMDHWLRHQVDVGNLAYANSGIYTRLNPSVASLA